jgi:hypothetical protein
VVTPGVQPTFIGNGFKFVRSDVPWLKGVDSPAGTSRCVRDDVGHDEQRHAVIVGLCVSHLVPRKEDRKTERGRSFDLNPKLTITLFAEQIEWLGGRDIEHFPP